MLLLRVHHHRCSTHEHRCESAGTNTRRHRHLANSNANINGNERINAHRGNRRRQIVRGPAVDTQAFFNVAGRKESRQGARCVHGVANVGRLESWPTEHNRHAALHVHGRDEQWRVQRFERSCGGNFVAQLAQGRLQINGGCQHAFKEHRHVVDAKQISTLETLGAINHGLDRLATNNSRSNQGANAGARVKFRTDARLLQRAEGAEVGKSFQCAATEHESNAWAGAGAYDGTCTHALAGIAGERLQSASRVSRGGAASHTNRTLRTVGGNFGAGDYVGVNWVTLFFPSNSGAASSAWTIPASSLAKAFFTRSLRSTSSTPACPLLRLS